MTDEFDNDGLPTPYARCLRCGTEGVYIYYDGFCDHCTQENWNEGEKIEDESPN